MAENEAPQGATPVEGETQTREIDWKAESRKWEARAKENLTAAKANEDAAKRLAEIEESQKTEAQKAQDALTKAQQELADERSARLRAEVAADKGIPAHLLTGGTKEELEKSADDLLAFKGDPQPQKLIVPNEGNSPVVTKTTAELFADAFNQR